MPQHRDLRHPLHAHPCPTRTHGVYCREQAGTLDQSIRYGIAVTIEAGEGIPVYNEVRARLAVPVAALIP